MPSNSRNPRTVLPSHKELAELVDESASIARDVDEWMASKSNPNASRPLLSILAPRRFSSDDEVRVAWRNIHTLPAYQKLMQHQNFERAINSFRKTIKPNNAQEARFLSGVAFYINRFLLETERPELIKQPLRRTRTSAVQAARKLRMLAKEGARLENLHDQGRLDSLLERLISEMDKAPEQQPRNDETRVGRLFVKRLALHFFALFGEPLTSVVSNLAAVVGYEPDQKNIDLVVREARREHKKRYRNALAKALLSHPQMS